MVVFEFETLIKITQMHPAPKTGNEYIRNKNHMHYLETIISVAHFIILTGTRL